MLSALRPQAARPGLLRPASSRLAVGVPAAVPRSGDGAGQQRPAGRRPKPRTQQPADEAPPSPRQQKQRQQPQPGAAVGGPGLTQLIQGAKSCEQVAQLLQQAGRQCNSFHFSAAANRVATLHELQPGRGDSHRAAFQQLAQLAVNAELNPWAVAQLMWAAGKLWEDEAAKQPFGARQAAWQQRLAAALADRECKPQSVSNSLLGASKLGWPLEGSLAAAAEAAVEQLAAGMVSQQVSNTLWAFANAGWLLGSRAAAALLQQLELVLPQAAPQAVSQSLWAMSKLGLRPSSSLAAAAVAAIQLTAGQMDPQVVSNTLWAFANAGWPLDSQAAAALLQQLELVLPQAIPQDVSNSLWAMSKLGWPLEGSLSAAVAAAVLRTAGQMDPQAVSNTLWAFANAGWPLGSPAAGALLQRLEQVLPGANAQDVANSLWAAARLGLQLSDSLQAAFAQALRRVIPASNSQDFGNSLLACGKLCWNPSGRVLAAAVAAMQQLLAAGAVKAQHVCNFLWGLAELQEHLGIKLPAELPALLAAAAEWADSRWAQLSALSVVDLCYNLARLGHRPGSAWIGSATERCLECIEAGALDSARFANLIWAYSTWGHQLHRSELEQLVPAAVVNICAGWPEPGRGGALRLVEALTRQEGFSVGADHPASSAALEGRLLPLVCADIDLVAAGQLRPENGELPYLVGWADLTASLGMRLPEQQLEAVCSYVGQHPQQLRLKNRSDLERACRTWGYQPGLALLGQLAGA